MTFQCNHLHGFDAVGNVAATRTYVASYTDTTDLTNYSFAGCSLGTAALNRTIVVIATASGTNNSTLSSATIAGVTANIIVGANNSSSTAYIITADVPTGATGTIAINWSLGKARCSISVYAAYGMAGATAWATTTGTAQNNSLSIDCPASGVVFGGGHLGASGTMTWTGITEDVDAALEAAEYTAASLTFSTQQIALSVTANWSASATQAVAVASFNVA